MSKAMISEEEFGRVCRDLRRDGDNIFRNNPIGTKEEVLLWMLLGVLTSLLSLEEIETPCFNGIPDASTYRKAIVHVMRERRASDFDIEAYLDRLTES